MGELLNRVQRHTQCSKDYCLRLDKATQQWRCRFGFPKETRDASEIVADTKGVLEFLSRRNDPLLNNFHVLIILFWLANMDLHVRPASFSTRN